MIDWKKYRLNFPERYFKRTLFDEKVESLLQIFPDIKTVLEIGGGYGSGILKLYNKETLAIRPLC